jgi:hypothetical protein
MGYIANVQQHIGNKTLPSLSHAMNAGLEQKEGGSRNAGRAVKKNKM